MTSAPDGKSQAQQASLQQVTAGRDVNVDLYQVLITGGHDSSAREVAESLLRGPLRRVGADDDAQRAFQLAESSSHLEAAELFVSVSARLSEKFQAVAEFFDTQAIEQLKQAGETARAAEIAVALAERHIERGDARAMGSARSAAQLVEDDAVSQALVALAAGVEGGEAGVEALRAVRLVLEGEGGEIEWAARLIERLVVEGRFAEAAALADEIAARLELEGDAGLSFELDYVDGLIGVGRSQDAAARCDDLLARAGDTAGDPATRARIFQRLAVVDYATERYADAERRLSQAIEQWGWAEGSEGQIAECFFAIEECRLRRGEIRQEGFMLRPWAASLTGSTAYAAGRGDALETRGLRYRVDNKLPDALNVYWQGCVVHHRAGNLLGARSCMAGLADVYEQAGARHASDAARFAALAGDAKKAGRTAAVVADAQAVVGQLPLSGSAIQRAASFAAIAALGSRLQPPLAAELAPQLVAEGRRPYSMVGPSAPRHALMALAALVTLLDDRLLGEVLGVLRCAAQSGDLELARSACHALIVATNAELSDETELLLEIALSDHQGFVHIPTNWVASQLGAHPELVESVLAAARGGSRTALEAAAVAEQLSSEPELMARCEDLVAAAVGQRNYETIMTEAGEVQTSMSMGVRYADIGIFARFAAADTRAAFFDSLLQVVLDANDTMMNRSSAGDGLFNLAPALTAEQAERAAEGLVPLALGKISLSHVDLLAAGGDDPLARFRAAIGAPEWLRRAAIVCLARLDATHLDVTCAPVLEALLVEETDPAILASSYEAWSHLGIPLPPSVANRGLRHPDAAVRGSALEALAAAADRLDPDVAGQVVDDPDRDMRLRLALIARHAGDADILRRLVDDPDGVVSAYAKSHLRALGASVQPAQA